MFTGDAAGQNMAGNDFSAMPRLIQGKPRVGSNNIFIYFKFYSLKIHMVIAQSK